MLDHSNTRGAIDAIEAHGCAVLGAAVGLRRLITMLQRTTLDDSLVIYRSPLLARVNIPHAFTTRLGGVSPAPYDSLDLGMATCGIDASQPAGGDPAHVQENYRRLLHALNCDTHAIAWAHQVHANQVIVIDKSNHDAHPRADALITATPGIMATVRAADCVPILLASDDGRVVAAVHAGWRGVVAGAVIAAIDTLQQQFNITPQRLIAAIGPCISVDHFEVGPEVVAEFEKASLGAAVLLPLPKGEGIRTRPHINLPLALAIQLRRAGITDDRIDTTDRCTFRDHDEFFSHRRDKGVTGRMVAAIAVR